MVRKLIGHDIGCCARDTTNLFPLLVFWEPREGWKRYARSETSTYKWTTWP